MAHYDFTQALALLAKHPTDKYLRNVREGKKEATSKLLQDVQDLFALSFDAIPSTDKDVFSVCLHKPLYGGIGSTNVYVYSDKLDDIYVCGFPKYEDVTKLGLVYDHGSRVWLGPEIGAGGGDRADVLALIAASVLAKMKQ
jgi:hypothetical protein